MEPLSRNEILLLAMRSRMTPFTELPWEELARMLRQIEPAQRPAWGIDRLASALKPADGTRQVYSAVTIQVSREEMMAIAALLLDLPLDEIEQAVVEFGQEINQGNAALRRRLAQPPLRFS